MPISGFPDAASTGVPAGVTLTASGGLVINTPGVVIEGLDIRGMVTINADNVTLKNCTITSGSWAVVNITSGSSGVVVQDCEINGLSAEGVRGISGQGTFLRNDIHHVEDGIYLTGSNTLIQDNYIHDLQSNWSGPHYDGIATDGGVSNITIRHNTVINDHGQTSALMLSNYFGSVSNVVVDNNWLEGGGYTVYSDGQFKGGTISGVSFTNNYLVKGEYGYSSIRNNTPVWEGNIQYTGQSVPAPGPSAPTITTVSDDSGAPGDGITNDNTLTLSGTAAANSSVKVYDGGALLGTAAVNNGTWSFTTAALQDGAHSFTATATSGSTTSSASSARSVTVDTVAPGAPAITSFSSDTGTAGDRTTTDHTLTLTGTAAANSQVKVYDGGTLLGTASVSNGTWSFTTATLQDGTHNFTATATDVAGNTGVASAGYAVTVTPDTGGPTTPPPSGWPDASNTGVPAGVTLLPSGDMIITQAGAIINGLDIRGTVYINAPNVTLMNCRITSDEFYVVKIKAGVTGVVVKDCDILGTGDATEGSNGIGGQGTFLRNDISNVENGIVIQGDNAVVQDNYIHGLKAGSNAHYDGIQIDGGISNATIRHNTVINDYGQTAALMINNWFGPVSNIVIDNNMLVGGGYTVYSDGQFNGGPITGVSFTNNLLGEGHWGYSYFVNNTPTWQGNTNDSTGQTVGPSTPISMGNPQITSFSNDTGTVGDGITADNTLTLSGKAPVFSTVTIYDGTKVLGTATADATNNWSFTTPVLADGSHSLTVTAKNGSQTTPASSPLVIKIDTGSPTTPTAPTAPTIASFSNDSGVAGDKVTNDKTLTLTGNAAANSTVKVFDSGNEIGSTVANGSGVWTYTTATLSEGAHNLTATATTSAGTSSASSTLAVKIDSTAPTAPTMTSSSASLQAAAASANTVSLTGTAEANSTVKVFDGGNQIGTAIANGNGTWSFTTGALTSGSHTFTSRAMDAAGNTGAASATVAVNIAPPTPNVPAAPKITSFSNDSGVSGDGITNDKTVTLTGTAAAYGTVKVFDGGVQIGTAKANGSGNWNFTTTALPDGNHSLTAKVTDANGNTSAASSALALKIDTVAPTTPKMAVAPSTSATAETDQVTLTGTAEANSTIKLFDGTTQIGSTKADANGSWSYTTDALEDGNHRITSKAVDVAGNTSASSAAVNVHVDSQAPTAEFISFSQKSNDTVYFKGTAEPYSQITIYDNGGSKAVATVKAGMDGIWSVTTASAVSDNVVHRFTATVMDSTGQAGSSSGSVVLGTAGNDWLTSTSGDDVFRGNGGHDTFAFAANFGNDIIADFGAGRRTSDVVRFSKSVFDDFADVMAHASQIGQDVVINAHQGNTLTLKNTSLTSLDRSDFQFV